MEPVVAILGPDKNLEMAAIEDLLERFGHISLHIKSTTCSPGDIADQHCPLCQAKKKGNETPVSAEEPKIAEIICPVCSPHSSTSTYLFVGCAPENWYTGQKITLRYTNSLLPEISLLWQVIDHFKLRGQLSPSTLRWYELIGSRAYAPARLAARGATAEEIERILRLQRYHQGVTAYQEWQAQQAILAAASVRERIGGRLTVIDLPHDHEQTVADRLCQWAGGPGYDQLLIIDRTKEYWGISFWGDDDIVSTVFDAMKAQAIVTDTSRLLRLANSPCLVTVVANQDDANQAKQIILDQFQRQS